MSKQDINDSALGNQEKKERNEIAEVTLLAETTAKMIVLLINVTPQCVLLWLIVPTAD